MGSKSARSRIKICSKIKTAKFEAYERIFSSLDSSTNCEFGIVTSSNVLLQGVRGQSGFFDLALRERNIQVRLYLKVVLKFRHVDILIIRTNFQKINLGWPQQPPTEKVQKFKSDIS